MSGHGAGRRDALTRTQAWATENAGRQAGSLTVATARRLRTSSVSFAIAA
jgi:hypothetical protein